MDAFPGCFRTRCSNGWSVQVDCELPSREAPGVYIQWEDQCAG